MIKDEIKELVRETIREAQNQDLLPSFVLPDFSVDYLADNKKGDYATNVALKIAALVKKTPMETAQILFFRLKEKILFAEVEIASPGFINFRLIKFFLQEQLQEILEDGANYGCLEVGQNKKVLVEFISANPTGPLTLGNARGGFFGDVLAAVLQKAGYRAAREFYINNAGEQVIKLGHSILNDEQAVYRGGYVEDLRKKIDVSGKEAKDIGQEAAELIINGLIKPVIEQKMKIKFDNWFSERDLHEQGKVQAVIDIFKEKDLVYEKEGAAWFKSTQFGDDKDRVLIKKDGQPTYLAVDIAYHLNKFKDRNFDKAINIVGADHHGEVARMKAAMEVLGFGGQLEIILYQFVRLMEDGREVKMSKRAGIYVTVEELIDEAGIDAARFFMLTHSVGAHLDFDLNLAKEQSDKNPVFYAQYAFARLASIGRKASEAGLSASDDNLKLLEQPAETELIKKLVRLPEIIEAIATDYQVQRLPQYALELVRTFHRFYEECRVISDNKDLSEARLALVGATKTVLKTTLDLMGIAAPEKM